MSNQTKPNQVQFSEHAVERVTNRYKTLTNYGAVQHVLANKPLAPSTQPQKVVITTFIKPVRVYTPEARNGEFITGTKIKAVVSVSQPNQVEVITVVLEN